MTTDVLIFDYMETEKDKNNLKIHLNGEQIIYIPKLIYDEYLLLGMENAEKTINQLNIDLPRCDVIFEGKKVMQFPHSYDIKNARYCTQAVMAMPVEILSVLGIVGELENPHRLRIDMRKDSIKIMKKLRILNFEGCFNANVIIYVDLKTNYISIKVKTFNYIDNVDTNILF